MEYVTPANEHNGHRNGSEAVDGPIGAVLVVGAGIGGMQASLDLAEAGFKVYLLERSPAIGGAMAQLDKTFPTNDCAMCIMSPKLVEVGRHLNIDVLTMAEVQEVSGGPGHFQVTVRQHPRYVNLEACTGCGDCAAVCPVVRPDAFNQGLSQRRAIYKQYPQAIPNAYAIEKRGVAPCRDACPIGQRAQGYVALVQEGRYADAYRTIKEDNPFPSVCGRVCNHVCEDVCSRAALDQPVNIMGLKRFVTDTVAAKGLPEDEERVEKVAASGKRVAVIGAGPAGLTCALGLVRQGHAATVYEALPVAGGMMRVGIPAFRLPRRLLQQEVDDILREGVELVLNHRVEDVPALLQDGFDAVFVATGAHRGVKLPIPGADLHGVLTATDFLREVSLHEANLAEQDGSASSRKFREQFEGQRVIVLGGGNVAIDAAMTALRLGASWVGMSCLESHEQMPAHDWEVQDAAAEGIEMFPSRTFKELIAEGGRVRGLRCAKIDFRGFKDGRPDFDEIAGTEETHEADVVIFAVGQRPDVDLLGKDVALAAGRYPAVDRQTLATNVPGLFAGGDMVTGTAFVVNAIAAGHRAARSIDHYLHTGRAPDSDTTGEEKTVATVDEALARQKVAAGTASADERHNGGHRPAEVRKRDFEEIYAGLSESEARAEAARCLSCGICSECNQCVYSCKAGAIDHAQVETELQLDVGAIVLAPGVEPLPGDIRPEYGYGRYANVVTSLEFERMLSASGPTAGAVKRPSDEAHPRKVAWIQCVGSRDCAVDHGYCSSVCCMYATKEALIAREHDRRIEPTIFYIDLRAFGKGFEGYLNRAEESGGVRYVRSMVSAVREVPGTRDLRLEYVTFDAQGKPVAHEEVFEMVVLSVGLQPSEAARDTARRLGVQLNRYGFAQAPPLRPATTSRAGVYVTGSFAEPKDIPETVTEASCAAAQAAGLLAETRGDLAREREYPPERDVTEEEPRIGVFVCHCGINIGGVVNVPEVVAHAQGLSGVVYAEQNLYTCSQDTQEKIVSTVLEQGLNRVVVASCTPRTHEPLFQDTIRQAGLNPHLFELANIREQDAWVHRDAPDAATEKAKQLVTMAVARSHKLRPLARNRSEVVPRALVIGGGLAGMTTALAIADQGFAATLVERTGSLGGHLQHLRTLRDGHDPQHLLEEMRARVSGHSRITVMMESEVAQMDGHVGHFRTLVRRQNGATEEVIHGAVVVASGGQDSAENGHPAAGEYGYGQLPGVLTQRELEAALAAGEDGDSRSVIMIQCVGSRNDEQPYCSRVCCTQAMHNALALKQQDPHRPVAILYRDIRTYGFREALYRRVREAGVLFLQFERANPPRVSEANDGLQVQVLAQPEREPLTLAAGRVVLSTGIAPGAQNEALSQTLRLPLNEDGFFMEAHAKLRPVDFASDGVFLCGLAHSPRSMEETMTQAQAAAMRAATVLGKASLQAEALTATVNPRLCAACGICVEVCPYGARVLEPGMAYAGVIEVLCQGCGACVVACPNKASQQKGFEFVQLAAMVDAALTRNE